MKENLGNIDMKISMGALIIELREISDQLEIRHLTEEADLINEVIRSLTEKIHSRGVAA